MRANNSKQGAGVSQLVLNRVIFEHWKKVKLYHPLALESGDTGYTGARLLTPFVQDADGLCNKTSRF
jgi:hypothetical protein